MEVVVVPKRVFKFLLTTIFIESVSFANDAVFKFAFFARFNTIRKNWAINVVKRTDCDIIHNNAISQTNFFVNLAIGANNTIFDGRFISYGTAFAHKAFKTNLMRVHLSISKAFGIRYLLKLIQDFIVIFLFYMD